MFKRKEKHSNMESVHFWPGIYKFQLPYLIGHNVPNDEGIVPVYTCDVEMHIGDQRDLDNSIMATVIISAKKGGVGTTNFIEHIATLIKKGYFDEVAIPKYGHLQDRIRWIERHYYPSENFRVVLMDWDHESNHYVGPDWIPLEENDWILKKHKFQPYT